MIKNNRNFKFTNKLKKLGCIFVMTALLSGCSSNPAITLPIQPDNPSKPSKPEIADVIRLPELQDTYDKLEEIYGGLENAYISNNGLSRRAYYKNKPTNVNICFEPNLTQKIILEDTIEEFNQIFKVINPNYNFVLNYSPTQEDLDKDEYAIDVYIGEINGNVGGQTKTYLEDRDKGFVGFEYVNCDIVLNQRYTNNGFYFSHIFRHEFMHTFGCGDAYLNENATEDTIMQSLTTKMVGLYKIDVAFLDALYRYPNNTKTDQEIESFIEHYNENNQYDYKNTKLRIINAMIEEMDALVLKQEIQSSTYLPSDISNITEKLGTKLQPQSMENITAFAEVFDTNQEKDEYEYVKTPYTKGQPIEDIFNPEPNIYDVFNQEDSLWSSSNNDEFYFNNTNMYIGNLTHGNIFTKAEGYIISLNLKYNFAELNKEMKINFNKLFLPTNKSLIDYHQDLVDWKNQNLEN